MFCDSYRKALSEALLVGGRLPGGAEAHLAVCAGCRKTFADEQALLQRIEAGVASLVVSETPASLIPGLRARTAGVAESRSGWRLVLALTTAALAVGVVAVSFGMRSKAPRSETPSAGAWSALKSPTATPPAPLPVTAVTATPRTAASRRAPHDSGPQVLITSDDQRGLDQYIAGFRSVESGNKATLKEEAGVEIKPLVTAELDVKRLSIEPLESSDSN